MMSLVQASQILQGKLHGEDRSFSSVSTDTRSLQQGALYFALKGERFDGHAFIENAQQSGAVAAVVSDYQELGLPQIQVIDTRKALAQLAAAWRQEFNGPVIGITGSNGKTTVKEMTAAILSKQGEVLATQGNFNNDIGLPLTLLRIEKNQDYAVIEMGANHAGEIDQLTHITVPDVAVITNAGPAHLEGFGSLQGVAEAKGEIYSGLSSTGVAVINIDDDYAEFWISRCGDKKIVRFSLQHDDAEVKGSWIANESGGALSIKTAQGECQVNLQVPGSHNAMNALAATAASMAAGASLQSVSSALSEFKSVKGRLNRLSAASGAQVIDDTYNANPASLEAGIKVLQDLPGEHWLVLGDMGELGEKTESLHIDVGIKASESGIHKLLAIGPNSKCAVDAFGEHGKFFESRDELIAYLKVNMHGELNILVKGSRFMQMEKVVEAITEVAG